MEWSTILTIALGLISTFLTGFWATSKGKIKAFINLGKDVFDVAEKFESAIEDEKITKQEIEEIKKELAEVKESWKVLVS